MSSSAALEKIEWSSILSKIGDKIGFSDCELGQGEESRHQQKDHKRLLIRDTEKIRGYTTEEGRSALGGSHIFEAAEVDTRFDNGEDSDIDSASLSSTSSEISNTNATLRKFRYTRSELRKKEFDITDVPQAPQKNRYEEIELESDLIPQEIPDGHIVTRIDFDRVLKALPKTENFRVPPTREHVFEAPHTKGLLAELASTAAREINKTV